MKKITNAKYHKDIISGKNRSINCIIGEEYCSVPMVDDNAHYQEIKKQSDAGTLTIEEAD
jgi:hypothetical protein